jgi:hypothetical protein
MLRPHLQRVCCNLVCKPDASPLLLKIDHYSRRVLVDHVQCQPKLLRTVTLQGAQHLCGVQCMQVAVRCTEQHHKGGLDRSICTVLARLTRGEACIMHSHWNL